MVDPTAFQQMEKSATELLLKILIPLWIALSLAVTIWSYKSTRAKVFGKISTKVCFLQKQPPLKMKEDGLENS